MLDRLAAKPDVLVRPTSFMIDLEGDRAEVMVASSAHDMTWHIHFDITPAPSNPDDWNQKIFEAYNRIVSLERSDAGADSSPSRAFVVGASGANGPSIVRQVTLSAFSVKPSLPQLGLSLCVSVFKWFGTI
jgi:hypothetical protein